MSDRVDVTEILEFIADLDGCVPRWVLFDMVRRVLHDQAFTHRLATPQGKPLRHKLAVFSPI